MARTQYFEDISKLKSKFSVIQNDFNEVLQLSIKAATPDYPVIKEHLDYSRKVMDRFDKHIGDLKKIDKNLETLREKVDTRSRSMFKTGNIKEKLDAVLSHQEIKDLKNELKDFNKALHKVEERQDYQPLREHLASYQTEDIGEQIKP